MVETIDVKAVFDLDNCLYQYDENAEALFTEAYARTLEHFGIEASEDFSKIVNHNMTHDHDAMREIFADLGVCFDTFHDVAHKFAIDIFRDRVYAPPGLTELFNAIAPENKVILTHGSRAWSEAMLTKIGVRHTIHDDHILSIDHDEIAGQRKDKSPAPFEIAADRLGAHPSELVFFDDLPENHVHANALGMRTVLIHWGEEIADALDHITDSVHDVTTWLKAHLHRQKKTDAIDTPKPPQP